MLKAYLSNRHWKKGLDLKTEMAVRVLAQVERKWLLWICESGIPKRIWTEYNQSIQMIMQTMITYEKKECWAIEPG